MKNLHFMANNSRFLILPWISVKCLASRLLALSAKRISHEALSAKRISHDWLKTYSYLLYPLETFVKKDRFKGTCYRAANWIWVGQTKGIAKRGHDHLFHGNIKDVYLYPLRKDFREKIGPPTITRHERAGRTSIISNNMPTNKIQRTTVAWSSSYHVLQPDCST
jgi:hypothetical protein